jgi:uncharacterized SAM-binding protein YcdF (DUF218 family)
MHPFLSSLLSFFLSPFHWILILLIAGFLFRKSSVKKGFRLLALTVFLLFSNAWLLNSYARKFQPLPVTLNPSNVYSCGIAAGGFASPDKEGNGFFNSTADRFIQVLKLYKQGHISHVLITGGNGKSSLNSFREAEWVKKQMILMGVPDSVIFVEDQSNNTAENAAHARKILDSFHLKPPYLLISSAHHLPRAMLLFKKAGVPVTGYPCSYIAGNGISTFADIIPSIGVLFTWQVYLKETAGYYWYR